MLSPTQLFQIEELPDLYVDACVCDEQRNLVFLSAWGRDTVLQEFLARLTLGREENGIDQFHVIVDGRRLPVFPDQDLLEKRTTRQFRGTLFGSLPEGAGIRLIQLDEQQRLEEQLSRLLPANPQQAAAAAQKLLSGPEGTRVQRDLLEAQQGVTDAWSVGVEKLPAVVVDRKYVVYGQPNVALALQAIEHSRGAR